MGTMSLTRADLKQVRENITYWNDMVTKLERAGKGRNRIYRGIPMD